jgi:hypothetical protein
VSDELVRIERPDPPTEIAVSIIKGALGAVPVIGQALMEALFDYRSRVKQERINRMLVELTEEIGRRADLKIDFSYLKNRRI